jgi:cell wall-associated NlpC family hydrolase
LIDATQDSNPKRTTPARNAGSAAKSLLSKFGRKATPIDTVVERKDAIPSAFRRTDRRARSARDRRSSALSVAVMALVVPGLFATVAIPAYAFRPAEDTTAADASQALLESNDKFAQTVQVNAEAGVSAVARDQFTATSAAEILRAELATTYAAYSGPTYSDYLSNPPYPNFDLAGIAAVAQQYQGVPYVFGGADPSGFDCSGFVMFVYSQFGVGLPHSVSGIEASGTIIDPSAAVPGDIVTMSGHNGIYLGGGMMIDAPTDGDVVRIRPIYTSSYWIVRIGI